MRAYLLGAAVLLAGFSVQAEEGEGLTVYPFGGQTLYSGSSRFDDEGHYGFGLGYRFENPWALELTYMQSDTKSDLPGVSDVDVDQYHIGALYHFATDNRWSPFLSFGAGVGEYSRTGQGDDNEIQLNAGGGLKYAITDKAHLRGDLRFYRGNEEDAVNAALSLGLHYAFGGRPAAVATAAPLDSDGDGVADADDACPNTPAGVEVDARGCPRDDDGDGVPNYADKCPGTTNRQARIDAEGCYVKLESKIDMTLNLEFDFDSAAAREEHVPEVQKVAKIMQEYPDSVVTIAGHTDSTGPADYNQGLSERRAATIAGLLTERFGIDASRVSSAGYGESQPIASNDTRAGRQENRRVMAHLVGDKEEIEMK